MSKGSFGKKIIALSVLFLLPLLDANAQQIASGRLISLGGLSTSISTDVDAIGTNPANLAALSRGNVVIEFAPISVSVGSDFLSLQLYNDYFTGTGQTDSAGNNIGTFLTPSDKQKILDAFPDGVGNVRFNTDIRVLAVSVRGANYGVSVSIDEKIGGKISLPNSILFPLNGNPPGSTISWNDMGAKSWWYRSYNVDYAMKIPHMVFVPKEIANDFSFGAGVKYVTGFSYAFMRSTNTSLYTDSTNYAYTVNMGFNGTRAGLISNVISKSAKSAVGDTVVNFDPLSPAGTGFGFDLGASARIMGFIKVGASFTDIGSISWSKNVVTTTGDTSFTFAGFSPAPNNVPNATSNLDSLKNAFNDYFKNKDQAGSNFSTSLPTKFNLGASVQLDELFPMIPGQLLVGVDYHQGLNKSFNNSTNPEFILGAEWKPIGLLPLRTGLGFGGAFGFRWSLGFGINLPFWDIDLGVGTFNAVVAPYAAKSVSIVLSVAKFRF